MAFIKYLSHNGRAEECVLNCFIILYNFKFPQNNKFIICVEFVVLYSLYSILHKSQLNLLLKIFILRPDSFFSHQMKCFSYHYYFTFKAIHAQLISEKITNSFNYNFLSHKFSPCLSAPST